MFVCKYCEKEFSEPALLFRHLNRSIVDSLLKRIQKLESSIEKICKTLEQAEE